MLEKTLRDVLGLLSEPQAIFEGQNNLYIDIVQWQWISLAFLLAWIYWIFWIFCLEW